MIQDQQLPNLFTFSPAPNVTGLVPRGKLRALVIDLIDEHYYDARPRRELRRTRHSYIADANFYSDGFVHLAHSWAPLRSWEVSIEGHRSIDWPAHYWWE